MDDVPISWPTVYRPFIGSSERPPSAFARTSSGQPYFLSEIEPMSKPRWLVVASICSLVAMPALARAQAADSTKEHAQDFVHDVLRALLGPNLNLFAHGGVTTSE